MLLNDKLKARRIELGLTMLDVAKSVGVSEATISRWESGDIGNMRRDKIALYAKALKTSPLFIMGIDKNIDEEENIFDKYDNLSPIKLKKFPLLGEIACGEPIWADEEKESYVMANMDIKADFCLTAKGDSMINARINDGDIVFIKKMPMVNNGEIAAVIIDNEATLKRVYYYPNKSKLVLIPENPAYEPLVYLKDELNTIRILGKAVYFMSAL